MLPLQQRLQKFLGEKNLKLCSSERIAKGYSSEIFLVENSKGEKLVLKIEKEKSPRQRMAEKEACNLQLANSLGVGPKLVSFDLEKRIILMEFIKGESFREWLFSNPSKKELQHFISELFSQAEKLDAAGLSHGQLAGKGANILARNGKPVIIDFEKASRKRKPRNVFQLASFIVLNKRAAITKKAREILSG